MLRRLLHFTEALPLPYSVTHSVYDMVLGWENFKTQMTLIDTVFLKHDLKRLSPLTAFFAPNDAWNFKIELDDISKSVLENMIFADLLWCETLRELKDKRPESHNGQTWKVTVNETTNMPCFDMEETEGGPVRRSCVTKCDVLTRNGIVHQVDRAFVYGVVETIGPQPPSIPTASNPNAPTFWEAPTPSNITWELPRPTFYGPINPAYAAVGEEGHGVRSAAAATTTTTRAARSSWFFWWSVMSAAALAVLAQSPYL